MSTRRVFVDTEWTAVPWSATVDLLWIGLSDESGKSWCGLCSDASIDPADKPYVADLMQLITSDVPRLPRAELSAAVLEFCAGVTEFWAWVPALESFANWSKLGESAADIYRQCKDIDLRMLRSLVNPWPPTWPTELRDLNLAATSAGAALPPRAPNHLHPRVHAEWNRQLFGRIQARHSGGGDQPERRAPPAHLEPPCDMPHLSVRLAQLSDLEALALLFNQYREFQGKDPDLQGGREFLRARFLGNESIVFLAQEEERPLGFAQLYPSFSSTAMGRVFILNDLFVHAAGRRKGVATALLEAVEAYAWPRAAVRVTLNVARDNAAGQALYEARGWKQDDQFFMYHRFPEGG